MFTLITLALLGLLSLFALASGARLQTQGRQKPLYLEWGSRCMARFHIATQRFFQQDEFEVSLSKQFN